MFIIFIRGGKYPIRREEFFGRKGERGVCKVLISDKNTCKLFSNNSSFWFFYGKNVQFENKRGFFCTLGFHHLTIRTVISIKCVFYSVHSVTQVAVKFFYWFARRSWNGWRGYEKVTITRWPFRIAFISELYSVKRQGEFLLALNAMHSDGLHLCLWIYIEIWILDMKLVLRIIQVVFVFWAVEGSYIFSTGRNGFSYMKLY